MSINFGVLGTGHIGQDHIRRISHTLSGRRSDREGNLGAPFIKDIGRNKAPTFLERFGELPAKEGAHHVLCVNHAPGAASLEQRWKDLSDSFKKAAESVLLDLLSAYAKKESQHQCSVTE